MAHITAGKVLKVSLLPGIIPRMHNLLTGGFGYISFYMAQIFGAVRLIPFGHPYLNPANMGRFGVGHVTLEAWATIAKGRWQIDQILIFLIVLLGLALLFLQFCFVGVALYTQTAHALNLPPNGFLNTENPETDLAFILMDSVFGLPDFFGSCVALSQVCFDYPENPVPHPAMPYPLPYHLAMRMMLQVYSIGLLAIAMIIFSYFAVAILIETAQHGTPFGKRFNRTWAPIRMVVAIALLMPIANGLNAAQYIVMYAAKWGSGFATTGWNLFIDEAIGGGGTLLGDPKTLIGIPNTPPINTLMEFATILAACKFAEASGEYPREIRAYVVFPNQNGPTARAELAGTTYADALERSNYGDIHYVFGATGTPNNVDEYSSFPGGVRPICGELVLKVTDVDDNNSPGSRWLLENYHILIGGSIWDDILNGNDAIPGQSFRNFGYGMVRRNMNDVRYDINDFPAAQDPNYPVPEASDLDAVREGYRTYIDTLLAEAINRQLSSPAWTQMLDFGWAGAGIWYNIVARLNGTLIGAVNSMPTVRKYPEVMEYVASQRAMHKQSGTGPERHKPELANGKTIPFTPDKQRTIAHVLYQTQFIWAGSYDTSGGGTNNPFIDSINAVMGTQGLFELSKNVDTHPLAGLVMMGKGLVEAALTKLGSATAAGLAGGLANFFKDIQPLGKTLTAFSSFAFQVAMIALVLGFMLFYVLPFMPFLYFFFAVGSWVKGIFEAIVGVPLWALAHIRIDGEGLPGNAALGGYVMVLEIFLRPILIIFGMLAAITIYSAQVKILNEIWYQVTSNVTGFNATTGKGIAAGETGSITYMRGLVDQFFFTVMYAIIVYMMGMASFKLIDAVPDKILRWLGKDGGAFSDQAGNAPDGLMTRMSIGANEMAGNLSKLGNMGISAAGRNRDSGGGQ